MNSSYNPFKLKLIYVFRINDSAHKGCLKIGEATITGDKHADFRPCSHDLNAAARARIDQYTQTAGITYELLHTELALKDYRAISDHDVHGVLRRSGVKQRFFDPTRKHHNEWFVCNLETARAAIAAALNGQSAIGVSSTVDVPDPIAFRNEQRQAINDAVKRFKAGHKKFLWNAKMRFGKTLCALQVIKEMKFKRVIIFTHRPDVLDGWYEDFHKIFFEKDCPYRFCAKRMGHDLGEAEARAQQEAEACYIYFASTQDLRGSKLVGGTFEKNDDVFSTPWDLVIIDEAHEGLQTELGKSVRGALRGEETRELLLSGTPFNLFDEFANDEIYTWDYVMEQRAKADWTVNHALDSNPYEVLPVMHMFTFDLGKLLHSGGGGTKYADIADKAFNFREFFRVYTGNIRDDHRPLPAGKHVGDLVHEDDVKSFLDLLVRSDQENNMPFATEYNRESFRHTLWMVPGVKEGLALSRLLNEHHVFGQFKIVNVAGEGGVDDEVTNNKALDDVRAAMTDHPEDTRTITLSCGKLTTGINVKPWTAVLMLAGSYSTSAANYMQTIFRVQTPATIGGRMKTDCYVFDFAPDRTLKVMAEAAQVSARAKHPDGQLSEKELLGEFLNFCPIISYNGTEMRHYDVNSMMEHLKRVYVDKVVSNGFEDVHLYNDELLKLNDMALEDFNELKKTIGRTRASHGSNEVDVNNQGFTDEEIQRQKQLKKKKRRELTPEELAELERLKEKKKNRANAISILRGISIRMPLMIYGAELKDNEEITINNFADKVDPSSWEEFMPAGVTKEMFAKFVKYYDEDIFRAAGRQIRDLALAADAMSITERVQRIASIFSSFRNPDKETVLTPWRVVNMHMSDTLGGYCFMDHDFKETLTEPRWVDRGQVTRDVFAPTNTRVLEINSKSGLYPLYMAYSIFRYRLDNNIGQVTNEQALWDQILRENLFVVCKTPMAKTITQRTLRGFRNVRVNARYFDDLINQIKNKQGKFIKQMAQGNNYWNANSDNNMKFNAIVGNPPYQLTVAKKETDNGQKAVINIFHYFQILTDRLNPCYSSLIYPGGRWIHRSGKGLAEFGLEQINDLHLELIEFFPDANYIFKEAGIADGISIVFKNYSKQEKSFNYKYGFDEPIRLSFPGDRLLPLNPRDSIIVSAIETTVKSNNYQMLHDSVLSRSLFSIESDFVEKNPHLVREYHEGDNFDITKEIKLFTNDKSGKSGRAKWYVANRDVITTGQEYLDTWKVIVSSANAGGQKRSNQIAVIDNYSAFGRARVALKTFKTKKEALNFLAYAKSEFIRFAFLLTDESLTSLAKLVPDIIDYTDNNGIIDFKGDINRQLYDLFDIDDESRQYIKNVLSKKAE